MAPLTCASREREREYMGGTLFESDPPRSWASPITCRCWCALGGATCASRNRTPRRCSDHARLENGARDCNAGRRRGRLYFGTDACEMSNPSLSNSALSTLFCRGCCGKLNGAPDRQAGQSYWGVPSMAGSGALVLVRLGSYGVTPYGHAPPARDRRAPGAGDDTRRGKDCSVVAEGDEHRCAGCSEKTLIAHAGSARSAPRLPAFRLDQLPGVPARSARASP